MSLSQPESQLMLFMSQIFSRCSVVSVGRPGFRGCPFVNAVAELGSEDQSVRRIAIEFKESRRLWFRDLLAQLGVTEAGALATQLTLLVDGSIAQDLVRNDPAMARAAKEAATVLLRNAGVKVGGRSAAEKRAPKKRQS